MLEEVINQIVRQNTNIPTQLGIQRQASRNGTFIAQQSSGSISSPSSLGLLVRTLSTVVLEVHGRGVLYEKVEVPI